MKYETATIASLMLDPANVRTHDSKNLESIKASLARFGQQKPIVVNSKGIIVAGNGTMMAAKMLNWSSVEIVRTDLEGAEAIAYAIADNRTAELAGWDEAALAQQLAALQIDDEELANIAGFTDAEIEAMILDGKEIEEDEVPEPPVDPITKAGDLWLLGNHRVLCGDSTKADDVARLMNGSKADITISDPPYGIGYEYSDHDDSNNDDNAELVRVAFSLGADVKVWTPGLNNLARDISRFGTAKVAVWFKKFAAAGNGLGGASVWEPILIVGRPKVQSLPTDVIECMTDRETLDGKSLRELHSCPKPVKLYGQIMDAFTEKGTAIHDPFLGSGTTLIAAEQLNRKCYGMEISPAYCDVIVKRWETLTGKTATLST
jgi:hypothetical protein